MELKEAVGEKMELQEEYLLVQQVTKQMDEEQDKYMKDMMDEAVENLVGEGVDDVDKKVDKEGAVLVLRDSRLSEDTFMIY